MPKPSGTTATACRSRRRRSSCSGCALSCAAGRTSSPIDIIEHPLPDVDALNAAIPKPWPIGLDGQEKPPWALHYVVYFCDPQTGSLYTFCNKTGGAQLAYEMLEEQIAVMRALRGTNVVPVVHLDQRPMKTKVRAEVAAAL